MRPVKYFWTKRYPFIGDGDDDEPKVVIEKDDKGRPIYKVGEERLFTQEHMNEEIGKARTKAAENNKALIQQLQEMQKKASTSEAMKTELQQQIEALQSKSLSKEEQMIHEIKTLKDQGEKLKTTLTEERDIAVRRWEEERITNALTAASIEHVAFSPEQIYGLLRQKTELKPVVADDGKPTGKHEVLVSLDTPEGVKQLGPAEALKVMKETMSDRYGNLFHSKEQGGVGGGNVNGSQVISDTPPKEALESQENYEAWRAAQKKR